MKAYCVICPNKTRLEEKPGFLLVCPVCGNKYDKSYEMIAHDDVLESGHEEESATLETAGLGVGGTGLMSARDEESYPSLDEIMEEQYNKEGKKIPIPKYMKGSNVDEFHEVID